MIKSHRVIPCSRASVLRVFIGLTLSLSFTTKATAGSWITNSPMGVTREHHTATLLSNGKVLVAGGYFTGFSAELYDPATGKWTWTGDMKFPCFEHTATLLSNG